jgi:hypothetical protein
MFYTIYKKERPPWLLVCKWTIPTDWPPLIGEVSADPNIYLYLLINIMNPMHTDISSSMVLREL